MAIALSPQLQSASAPELRDELIKIKQREQKAKKEKQEASERVISDVIAVGGAGVLSWYLGGKEQDARKAEGFNGLSEEDQTKKIHEAQSIAGFDIDLVVGIAGIGLAMTDMAGQYDDMLNALGVGGLAAYASRAAYQRGLKKEETQE